MSATASHLVSHITWLILLLRIRVLIYPTMHQYYLIHSSLYPCLLIYTNKSSVTRNLEIAKIHKENKHELTNSFVVTICIYIRMYLHFVNFSIRLHFQLLSSALVPFHPPPPLPILSTHLHHLTPNLPLPNRSARLTSATINRRWVICFPDNGLH